ncbi:16807_t:CDS:2 [Funneliformis caledonium]|uniref:ATP synthase subunit d, mitochondrial n=2 Tax=Funneliformis TaxID=1117308 RepID=A0A9N9EVK8_9GLOM|nr:1481_t:CDS:2 [Funneliformis mosseae]CAG8696398.1 16807_t:CDS:2 [Funneliformis caledonium]
MASSIRAAAKVDWSKLTVSLGLKKETVAALQAFRKRNDEARRVVLALKEQKTDIDFEHYRSLLKNKGIVNEAEKALSSFKPVKTDLNAQMKIVEIIESKAVENAKKTVARVDDELKDLHSTLTNIEQTRPFEDITVEEIVKAKPEINDIVEKMVKRGQWGVPGYEEKFGYGS